jgi:hypothetical protein
MSRVMEAAELMWEHLEGTTTAPWNHWHMLDDGRLEVYVPNGTMDTETILEFKDHLDCEECHRPTEADAAHIASWHPGVARAVAAALIAIDAASDHSDWNTVHAALNRVADAYLRSAS